MTRPMILSNTKLTRAAHAAAAATAIPCFASRSRPPPLPLLSETQTPAFMLSIADATRSVRRLRRLSWRAHARVVPGHDPVEWPSFKLAPEHYA